MGRKSKKFYEESGEVNDVVKKYMFLRDIKFLRQAYTINSTNVRDTVISYSRPDKKAITPELVFEIEDELKKAITKMEKKGYTVRYCARIKGIQNSFFTVKTHDDERITYKTLDEYLSSRARNPQKFDEAAVLIFNLDITDELK